MLYVDIMLKRFLRSLSIAMMCWCRSSTQQPLLNQLHIDLGAEMDHPSFESCSCDYRMVFDLHHFGIPTWMHAYFHRRPDLRGCQTSRSYAKFQKKTMSKRRSRGVRSYKISINPHISSARYPRQVGIQPLLHFDKLARPVDPHLQK